MPRGAASVLIVLTACARVPERVPETASPPPPVPPNAEPHPVDVPSFGSWLNVHASELSAAERTFLAREVFIRPIADFDAFDFAMANIDEWRAAGHPEPDPEPFATTIRDFFTWAVDDEDVRWRLADALLVRRDPLLMTKLVRYVTSDPSKVAGLIDKLEQDELLFRAGVNEILHGRYPRSDLRRGLMSLVPVWWRDKPKRRGLVLYIWAREHGGTRQEDFARWFGTPISKEVFAAFVAEACRDREYVRIVRCPK